MIAPKSHTATDIHSPSSKMEFGMEMLASGWCGLNFLFIRTKGLNGRFIGYRQKYIRHEAHCHLSRISGKVQWLIHSLSPRGHARHSDYSRVKTHMNVQRRLHSCATNGKKPHIFPPPLAQLTVSITVNDDKNYCGSCTTKTHVILCGLKLGRWRLSVS